MRHWLRRARGDVGPRLGKRALSRLLFFAGLIGSAVLGVLFDIFGWTACVAGIAVSLLVAALLAVFLKMPMAPDSMAR